MEIKPKNLKQQQKKNLKRGAKGRDWAQPVLETDDDDDGEEKVGQRLERPKLSMQNAPTRGKRRRSV